MSQVVRHERSAAILVGTDNRLIVASLRTADLHSKTLNWTALALNFSRSSAQPERWDKKTVQASQRTATANHRQRQLGPHAEDRTLSSIADLSPAYVRWIVSWRSSRWRSERTFRPKTYRL